jgi:glyoxylase-like metal-dependent hydrolase (beta-lactamase superfamily II)
LSWIEKQLHRKTKRSAYLTATTKLNSNTWSISLPFQGEEGIVGSYLLAGDNDLVLIDPGPESMLKPLLDAISTCGFEPRDVTHILATHIHLDHAGAAGSLLHHMQDATVYAHSKGAPHMIDTSKVLASATRIYGKRMQELWGKVEPVPADRLRTIEHGDTLSVAGRNLHVYYTPGHAIHHVIFFDDNSGELFAGDTAGVRLQDVDYVRPPTPPPDIDLEAWFASIDTMEQLSPSVLYLGHFGPTRTITQHLARLREQLNTWGDFILQEMRADKTEQEILNLLIARTDPELLQVTNDPHALQRYEIAANYPMSVQGYMRYWRKKHPEKLAH